MKFAGRPSWSLAIGDDQQLTMALYVRDAAGLVVADDGAPPPLLETPPAAEVLGAEGAAAVGQDWLTWWRALVRLYLEGQRAPRIDTPEGRAWLAERAQRRAEVGDLSDDFAGLAHVPALQRACRALAGVALAASGRWPDPSREWLGSTDVGSIVREVAAARGVAEHTLSGTVVVLPTGGTWWHLVEPGALLASVGASPEQAVRAALEPPPPPPPPPAGRPAQRGL